jgi:hypothetical protein
VWRTPTPHFVPAESKDSAGTFAFGRFCAALDLELDRAEHLEDAKKILARLKY